MPRIESPFRPAWWLPGHHLPTLWPALFRRRPRLAIERERLELPDGDFIDLSWHGNRGDPVVLLLHGLEGSLDSHYARPFLETVAREGYRGCLFHFRGCSGEPNRLPRSYHSGDTGDLEQVVSHIRCPPWRAKRRRVVPGSREATRDTRRAEGAKGDPKGASERGVQSYGKPVCSRNELAMLWRNAG